jgi:hypothetical protein
VIGRTWQQDGGFVVIAARSIKLPVGKKGTNLEPDVRVIQELVNAALESNPKFRGASLPRLKVDGRCGERTETAIATYQERVLGWSGPAVDGTVEPDKTTWRSLNGNVAAVAHIKHQVAPRPTVVHGYQAFRQRDFASTRLGEGDLRISGHGCALCTLTMAATVIGTPTRHWPEKTEPKGLTPPIVNTILVRAGAFSGSELIMPGAAQALGMTYNEFGRSESTRASDVSLIELNLTSGYPVAAHVDYKSSGIGDHWILVIRRTAGAEFEAIDPATGRLLKLTSGPQSSPNDPPLVRNTSIDKGVLFGWGQGGSKNQQQYVVVRFALLGPAVGGFCAGP